MGTHRWCQDNFENQCIYLQLCTAFQKTSPNYYWYQFFAYSIHNIQHTSHIDLRSCDFDLETNYKLLMLLCSMPLSQLNLYGIHLRACTSQLKASSHKCCYLCISGTGKRKSGTTCKTISKQCMDMSSCGNMNEKKEAACCPDLAPYPMHCLGKDPITLSASDRSHQMTIDLTIYWPRVWGRLCRP